MFKERFVRVWSVFEDFKSVSLEFGSVLRVWSVCEFEVCVRFLRVFRFVERVWLEFGGCLEFQGVLLEFEVCLEVLLEFEVCLDFQSVSLEFGVC